MLTKESKIRVLENFYTLDYIFFGKPLTKLTACCPTVRHEYLSVKGALMSVVVEMLRLVKHSPKKVTERVSVKDIMKGARKNAKLGRENAEKIVKSKKSRDSIKTELQKMIQEEKDIVITKAVENKIRERAFCLAVDNILIARTISESKNYKELNSWTGKILEDSYKILRDSLVESVCLILGDEHK